VHTVLSHRRPTPRSTRLFLLVAILCGLLVAAGIAAPMALAQVRSWVAVGPSRTVAPGQGADLYAVSGGGALRTRGMTLALHQQNGKNWTVVAIRKADASGKATFRVWPKRETVYRAALVGNSKLTTSYSRWIRIKVSSRGNAVVAEAAKHRGKPYRYGAAGPYAFDCSGFTQYVYRKFGLRLPHSATSQARYGRYVSKSAARPGDLVVFGSPGRYYHAGIYAGGGTMWDSSTYGQPVAKRRIWTQGFAVRRLV